jgi:hypothetical protein
MNRERAAKQGYRCRLCQQKLDQRGTQFVCANPECFDYVYRREYIKRLRKLTKRR